MNEHPLRIFSGNANPELSRRICDYLQLTPGDVHVGRFPDGELDIKINEDVRGCDTYIVQSTCPPVNENLMEVLIMIDCFKRASATRISAVLPYYGYGRKDRKDEGRVPITAKLVADLLTTAGVDRVLTIDLHASQIQGFFNIPVDHLFAAPVLTEFLKKENIPDLVIGSPDVGGIKMARAYAKVLGGGLAIVDKRRLDPRRAEVMNIIGEVKGKNIVLVDDLIATAGSISEASFYLKEQGAKKIRVVATHPVLCGPALERIQRSPIEEIIVTDSIPLTEEWRNQPNLKVLSIAPLLGEAIWRIHSNKSVSSLFVK
ncbi:MAG: ribose-phosphate pyrophosphokinase [Planctomycetota bacterium]